ncbi:hypothetical protein HY772_05660, partial [Candidatus Woesearchaeota archaeon]|nr:hypothetical protein [Candidatus Woesearchaeota archaeon]
MTSKRVGAGLVVLSGLAIILTPMRGRSEGLIATPGEIIVAFADEEGTVLEIEDCLVTSTYSALNDIFGEYGLICARPLFQAHSLMKNVFLLTFPPATDLDVVAGEIDQLGIMNYICGN